MTRKQGPDSNLGQEKRLKSKRQSIKCVKSSAKRKMILKTSITKFGGYEKIVLQKM